MTQRAQPERQLQTQVIELATYGQWRWYHPGDNLTVVTRSGRTRRQAIVKGFPDLQLIRPPEFIVVELKAENGRVSPEQHAWLEDFRACGIEAYVWRPGDWDEIHARLTRQRLRAA